LQNPFSLIFCYFLEKPAKNKNDNLYQLLAVSRKKITKKKLNHHLELKIMRKVPYFLQPVRSYQVFGDFMIHDSIFSQESTFQSSCILFNMNTYKKITQIVVDENTSLMTVHMSAYSNLVSPSLDLLVDRLTSISDFRAKNLTTLLINVAQMFNFFENFANKGISTISNAQPEKLADLKESMEKQLIQKVDSKNPFFMINTYFNHKSKKFEYGQIKLNFNLIQILGYKIDEFVEHCLEKGFPGILVYESYFTSISNIVQSRLSGQKTKFPVKLITSNENQLQGECQTYNCKLLFENAFYCSFIFEFHIYPWSLIQIKKNNEKKSKNNENGSSNELMLDKNKEIEKFMNTFYANEFQQKFKGKLFYNRAGYQCIKE